MNLTAQDWAALAANPIRPDEPAGTSVTYDPVYDSLKAEIAKLDSLQGGTPDWLAVQTHAIDILQSKSKDLTVASYLALASFRQDGYAGLAQGLTLCRSLLERYWETLFPEIKRMRGRAAAITWLNDRIAPFVTRQAPGSRDREAVLACVSELAELNRVLDERFGADAPSTGDLRRALDEAERSVAPPAAAAPAASGAVSAPAGAVDSVDAALKVLRGASQEARRAVDFLVRNDPSSPVPYLVARGLAWSMYREAPQDKDGITMLSAPEAGLFPTWERMAGQGEWKALLEDAEPRVLSWPLCLDLNYFVGSALSGLGFEKARAAVVDQCLCFIRRFPSLPDLKFQDGRPFASEQTRAWLRGEAAAAGAIAASRDGGETAPGTDGTADPLPELLREAKTLAGRGRLAEAAGLVQQGMAGRTQARERFRARLALAEICLEANQPSGAAALLEALDQEITGYHLEEWEPDLAFTVLKNLYLCEKKLGQKGGRDARETAQQMDRLYARLCRLDLPAALALESKR